MRTGHLVPKQEDVQRSCKPSDFPSHQEPVPSLPTHKMRVKPGSQGLKKALPDPRWLLESHVVAASNGVAFPVSQETIEESCFSWLPLQLQCFCGRVPPAVEKVYCACLHAYEKKITYEQGGVLQIFSLILARWHSGASGVKNQAGGSWCVHSWVYSPWAVILN